MTFPRLVLPVVAFLAAATPAQAGWDNVFQVACWRCRDRAPLRESRFFAPRPVTSTTQSSSYYEDVQKEETVTVMRPTTETVPIQVQERRYYEDPVTTYTTRRYRNANGCLEDVSVPCTRLVQKVECNTVTKYVERMKMVAVQETRKYTERTPVTVIRGTPIREYQSDCDNCGPSSAPGRAPVVVPESDPNRMAPQDGVKTRSQKVAPLPPVRPFSGNVNARTTGYASAVRGEVLAADKLTPKAGAKLVFLNDADYADRVSVTADDYGSFVANLAPGMWHVYVGDGARADRTTTVTVAPYDARPLTVVSK